MHVQSCGFAENNYFFDVVVVLSWWWLLKLPSTSGRSRGAGPGAVSPPPPHPKVWIHHSLLYQVKLFRGQIRKSFVLQHTRPFLRNNYI